VAYYLVHSGMSAPEIKKELKTVIRELQRSGLTFIATIYDHGSCNLADINMMIAETREKLIKEDYKDLANTLIGFFIDDSTFEIVPIFDPAHLLEGIRNNLLKHIWLASYGRRG